MILTYKHFLLFNFIFFFLNIGTVLFRAGLLPSISLYIALMSSPFLFHGFKPPNYLKKYLLISIVFIFLYSSIGFFGEKITLNFYEVFRLIGKLFVTIIFIPILMYRLFIYIGISNFISIVIKLCLISYVFLILNYIFLDSLFSFLNSSAIGNVRPGGLHINPNMASLVFILGYIAISKGRFKNNAYKYFLIGIFLSSVLITESRTALITFLLIFIWDLIEQKETLFKKLIRLSLFIIFLLIATFYFFDFGIFSRLRTVIDISYIYNSRLYIQIYALNVIANDILIGLGHGSMDRIVPIGGGLGPHNMFIYILGNSGIIPLVAYLTYIYNLFLSKKLKFYKSKTLSALMLTYILASLTNHDVITSSFFGFIIGFALIELDKGNQK